MFPFIVFHILSFILLFTFIFFVNLYVFLIMCIFYFICHCFHTFMLSSPLFVGFLKQRVILFLIVTMLHCVVQLYTEYNISCILFILTSFHFSLKKRLTPAFQYITVLIFYYGLFILQSNLFISNGCGIKKERDRGRFI